MSNPDDNNVWLRNLALSMYEGEPCRICGEILTKEAIQEGAVFAGYAKNIASRAAHKQCWDEWGSDKASWAFSEDGA